MDYKWIKLFTVLAVGFTSCDFNIDNNAKKKIEINLSSCAVFTNIGATERKDGIFALIPDNAIQSKVVHDSLINLSYITDKNYLLTTFNFVAQQKQRFWYSIVQKDQIIYIKVDSVTIDENFNNKGKSHWKSENVRVCYKYSDSFSSVIFIAK